MSSALPTVAFKPGQSGRLRQGHPWAYANELVPSADARELPPGALVTLRDADGRALGIACWNPHVLIAARLLDDDPSARIDSGWFAERLSRCLALRTRLFAEPYYRLVHAEADRLPGLIIDRYGDVLSVQVNTAGMEGLTTQLLDALKTVLSPQVIVLRNDSPAREVEGLPLAVSIPIGDLSGPIPVRENGATFLADLSAGQKTGWFFDQRDNRALAARWAARASGSPARTGSGAGQVLDLYGYTGGFAIQAARAGADRVVSVDRSEPALALVRQAAFANDVEARVETRRADVFDLLPTLLGGSERFGLVIADPPAFAKSRRDQARAQRGYRKLAKQCAGLVAPEGVLFIASCSHHIDPPMFAVEVSRGLADAGRRGRILAATGAGPDHPVHPFLLESAYLKALLIALD